MTESLHEREIFARVKASKDRDAISTDCEVVHIPRRSVPLKFLAAESERIMSLLGEMTARCRYDDSMCSDLLGLREQIERVGARDVLDDIQHRHQVYCPMYEELPDA